MRNIFIVYAVSTVVLNSVTSHAPSPEVKKTRNVLDWTQHKDISNYNEPKVLTLVHGYHFGLILLGLSYAMPNITSFPEHNPTDAFYYTTAYRTALKHLSLATSFLIGKENSYMDTHKIWKRNFQFEDQFVPKWMRYLLPWISQDNWAKVESEYERFSLIHDHSDFTQDQDLWVAAEPRRKSIGNFKTPPESHSDEDHSFYD